MATATNMVSIPNPLYESLRAERARTGVPMCRLLLAAWEKYTAPEAPANPALK